MAVLTVTGTPVAGTKYTVTTASSADWASVSNSTYFFDLTDKLVHYKDSTGAIIELFGSGAGGLTYFTEAQSTASPNATVNVDSLTAVASTTNADFAIIPKGTGAILGQIPDGVISAGLKRGIYATDLQRSRTGDFQVASGQYSTISGGQANAATADYTTSIGGFRNYATVQGAATLGGYYNNASGAYSATIAGQLNTASNNFAIAGGESNTSSGYCSVALGAGNTPSNTASIGIGRGNSVSGGGSVGLGYSNTVSSTGAVALCYYNNASGDFSLVGGAYGSDFGVSARNVFGANNTVLGDAQKSTFILSKRTTGSTATVLSVQGAGVGATNQLTLQNNNSIRFKGTIIGRQSGSTNTSAWDIDGIIQRGVGVGTTTLLISNVNVVQNTPAWGTPTLTANTTLGCLTVSVIGATSTNIQWTCVIDTTEVIYA